MHPVTGNDWVIKLGHTVVEGSCKVPTWTERHTDSGVSQKGVHPREIAGGRIIAPKARGNILVFLVVASSSSHRTDLCVESPVSCAVVVYQAGGVGWGGGVTFRMVPRG